MKIALIAVTLAALAGLYMMNGSEVSVSVENEFQEFITTYRKSYLSAESYAFRIGVFAENLKEIDAMNIENPAATYVVNEFADWTVEEKMAILSYKPVSGPKSYRATRGSPKTNDVDWVSEKETTPVKDQKSCGSCWAFSAIETLESTYALANGLSGSDMVNFAEQQMVDCVRGGDYESEGCNGGWMDDVFTYAERGNLFCTEAEYPYKAKDGKCDVSKCSIDTGVTGTVNIPEGDSDALLEAIEVTPVAVAVDASNFFAYGSGVHKCSSKNLNHGVQADGYHIQSNDADYYLVRNSWGARWGDSGFIKIGVDDASDCGITLASSYPQHKNSLLLGKDKCDDGKDADPETNCLCTYGKGCDKTGKDKTKKCKDECGCGEFGFCR
jgi:C1A family cysteine protease